MTKPYLLSYFDEQYLHTTHVYIYSQTCVSGHLYATNLS